MAVDILTKRYEVAEGLSPSFSVVDLHVGLGPTVHAATTGGGATLVAGIGQPGNAEVVREVTLTSTVDCIDNFVGL